MDVGNSLACLEPRVLLDRLPDLHLVTPDEPPLRPADFVFGHESLPVAFTPTAPVGARP